MPKKTDTNGVATASQSKVEKIWNNVHFSNIRLFHNVNNDYDSC